MVSRDADIFEDVGADQEIRIARERIEGCTDTGRGCEHVE